MEKASNKTEELKRQIAATEKELQKLKEQLASVERQSYSHHDLPNENPPFPENEISEKSRWPLSSEEYKRYGRQMIVPNIGIQGQLSLKNAKVLIIGAGGLGCPAAAYIAGSGVGTIGLVDGDDVETSNLHRQILHNTARVGMKKVDSAVEYLKALNPNPIYIRHSTHLTPTNAFGIVSPYDLVLDCTDHPTSRYLISDICVLINKPLISASALRTDGQLIILNSPPLPPGNSNGGPCYRCVFPKPPPAESVVSCGDGGILGPVVGVMGVLQAVEAIKFITSGKIFVNGEETKGEAKAEQAGMLLYSANNNPPFRSLKMRPRRAGCFACSKDEGLTLESLNSGSLDYVLFCGLTSPVKLLKQSERIKAEEYAEKRKLGENHLLVDVREKIQFDICSLQGSINVPFSSFPIRKPEAGKEENFPWIPRDLPADAPIFLVCRLGNDSQVVAQRLLDAGLGHTRYIGDIKDGLKSWKEQVDPDWPEY